MKKLLLITILTIILLSSCATTGSFVAKEQNDQKALVYLYRPMKAFGMALAMHISINQEKIINLKAGNYTSFYADPHDLLIYASSSWDLVKMEGESEVDRIKAEPGKTYYVKFETSLATKPPKVTIMEDGTGLKEINNTSYQEPLLNELKGN